jgi:hypothetical protein
MPLEEISDEIIVAIGWEQASVDVVAPIVPERVVVPSPQRVVIEIVLGKGQKIGPTQPKPPR